MEDDESIRAVIEGILSHYGYEVAFAQDGTEAIDLYGSAQETGTPFDVIIMDIEIPRGMGAKETLPRIRALDSQAKAIVVSGHANDPIMRESAQYGFCERIVKPYGLTQHEELH
jgi:CheY-like chemotaxis protein